MEKAYDKELRLIIGGKMADRRNRVNIHVANKKEDEREQRKENRLT